MRWMPFFLCLFLLACSDSDRPQPPAIEVPLSVLTNAAEIASGAALFSHHCSECHGTAAEGRSQRALRFNPPAPDFYAKDYLQADPAYLFWRISSGKNVEPFYSMGSVMPAYGPYLSDAQIWQLVAYLRSRPANSAAGL